MKICSIPIFTIFLLSGCAPFVPMENLKTVPLHTLAESMKIRIVVLGSFPELPVSQILGDVSAYSCQHMAYEPPASKGDAIKRLRLAALKLEADAVIDVTFDERGTDAFGTNCWETVHASGQAVKLKTEK